MRNFGGEHQRYLVSIKYKIKEDYLGLTWYIFYNNHYTKHVDQVLQNFTRKHCSQISRHRICI